MHYVWGVIIPNDNLEEDLEGPFNIEDEDCRSALEEAVISALARHSEEIGGDVWDWYLIGGRWNGILNESQTRDKAYRNTIDSGTVMRVRDLPENLPRRIHGLVYYQGDYSERLDSDPYDEPFYRPSYKGGNKGSGLYKVDEAGDIIYEDNPTSWTGKTVVFTDEYKAFQEKRVQEFGNILVDRRDDWLVIVDCHR